MIEGLWSKTTVESHKGLLKECNFYREGTFDEDLGPLKSC